MKHIYYIALLLSLLLSACGGKEKTYVIGISQCMTDDDWRQAMIREVGIEASNYDNLKVIIKDADSNNDRQIEQIRELIRQKVDVLVISPLESAPLTAVAEEAYRAGIPTIITDRKVNTSQYTTFVGANNYELGVTAGKYAARYLPPNATILEIWGAKGSSPAQERHNGFRDALSERKDLTFVPVEGEWKQEIAAGHLRETTFDGPVDFVFAHNDVMAIAAREYFLSTDSAQGKRLPVIGMDAVAEAGLQAIADGRIDASFLYPTGGEQVVRTAMRLINGETVDPFIPLHSGIVDKEAARSLLLQTERLLNYQQRIETQRTRMDELLNRFLFLRSSVWVITLLMIGFISLSVYVFYINRKIRLANRELREINKKEEEQRRKLISLNAEIEEVTASKLQFFTNISHEVRTPLTLILGPLDKLIGLLHDSPYLPDLELVHKNAGRLLRVINQILDFRKVENKQEKLKIRETEIVSFTGEVKSYFNSMAKVRNIDYLFTADTKECRVWLDPDMIEKVIVNLLSNAFKFTPEGGRIAVKLSASEAWVTIVVEDNGSGIQPENIPYLFNRFYSENSRTGTGIGLHLVNEYIRMHNGRIDVESMPGKGSAFTFSLHRDKTQLKGEYITEIPVSPLAYDASCLDDSGQKELLAKEYPYTVLVVEDDDEVRTFLCQELTANFRCLTAANGKEALELLNSEEISLVLSDVMMPEMNGFELCKAVKTNLATSHIPLILLTALTDERQRMYGISGGADGYIQKPFRMDFVKLRIIRILEERKKLRETLLQKLQSSNLLMGEPEKVENMDDFFLRKFLIQIEQVYADPEYNIERLSDTLGLSRGHLHRKIKDLTGTSPVDFLRNYRLKKAAVLLKQRQYNVSEIAYQTGFSSSAYFAKCFKAAYNVTPTEYQGN
ncbi:substrate-binding domain-containing protein [Parabacteroides acidifaciens]|uniref:histidine kinase n=1 Tax=Parabacteroides acidifaciens TaxID=2290935 RepID=A0A3D8HC22_9BACT|nr:substrate-binding domain-containing protein [Parabacteroides acidifaciens]MBC8602862.1 substrate-binding domain-containing protein [Parabacteroides acidifaciens]RDU48411.1 response regulator [Parabacteroides acidifaciens]